ncbi:MAG: hypothetical protein HRU11_14995 [Parvularculaceae bacterium]|nr:hypothetical protein [Parvularculaceae bacterium]
MSDFQLNSDRQERLTILGHEGAPLLIVDHAFAEPEKLVDLAKSASFQRVEGNGNHFPGVRSELPDSYPAALLALLDAHKEQFSLADLQPHQVTLNHLQMVTTPPAQLSLPQRFPHFDTFDSRQIAFLHYLTEDDHGGTDFYRHRATGFERIHPDRFRPYTGKLVEQVTRAGMPPADYIRESNDMFEKIESVPSRFNRLIVYFSNSLHSGFIPKITDLSADPAKGRLMATSFIHFPA